MKVPKPMLNWAILLIPAIMALGTSRVSAAGIQQTIITSSTRVVVVVIPGFPAESILLGFLVGLGAVLLLRLRRIVSGSQRPD